MREETLASTIRDRALSLGYDQCGLIRLKDMDGYSEALNGRINDYPDSRVFLERLRKLADVTQARPWARSVLVCARSFGHYRVPDHLRGRIASIYLLNNLSLAGGPDDLRALEASLADFGLRAEGDRHGGLTAMRWAAQAAGLGVIRRNNFFYTERGSQVWLEAWLLDRDMELKEESSLPPCPEKCDKCLRACPTSALRGPYSMCPTECVTFLTAFSPALPMDNPHHRALGQWIFGCDECQNACPHNRALGEGREDCPGLDELADQISLAQLMGMDQKTMRELLPPRFWYIGPERVWRWKVNILNALNNNFQEEYRPLIEWAAADPVPEVRATAAWVAGQI